MVVTVIFGFLFIIVISSYLGILLNNRLSKKYFQDKKLIYKILFAAGIEILIICAGICIGTLLIFLFAMILGPLAVIPVIFIYLVTASIITILLITGLTKKNRAQ
jgi:hypothetical protein